MTLQHIEKLYYTIADHLIAIETPGVETTAKLIPNFESFRTGAELINSRPHLCLSGNHSIPDAMTAPVEKFSRDLNQYAVYTLQEELIIEMTRQSKTYRLMVSSGWRTFYTDLSLTNQSESPFLNNFILIAYTLASSGFKTIKIHASVIEKEGKAVLFLGKSGTGKSTHSRLWLEYVPGSNLLNDDEPVIRIFDDGSVKVYGSPWSGKTPCYKNCSAEVRAIVKLFQSQENKLSRLEGISSFSSVFQACSVLRSNKQNKELVFDSVADLTKTIPVYRLDCRPDRVAVCLTETLL